MANFRSDKNGKTLPKSKFPSIRVRENTASRFKFLADSYGLTQDDLLNLLLEKKNPNGHSNGNGNGEGKLTTLEKLLKDFQKGEGIFG